jgi:hypothetical protein
MKFIQRKYQVVPDTPGTPRVDDGTTHLTVNRAPPTCVVDFFECRDRLSAGFDECSKESERNREGSTVDPLRLPSVDWSARLEESLNLLLSAAMVVYLLLAIIGL